MMEIDNIEFDGVDYNDYPDFCDAFISYAERNGIPLNDRELDKLNDDRDFVYNSLINYLF